MGMNEDMTDIARERDVANSAYFLAFRDSRFSLLRLPLMSFMTATMVGVVTFLLVSMIFYNDHEQEFLPLFYAHIVVMAFSVLVWMLSFFRGWVFRFQVLSTGLMAFFAVAGWLYACCFLAAGIASVVDNPEGGKMISADILAIFAVWGSLLIIGATVTHVLLLRRRLRVGHSAQRTMANLFAQSSVYSSKSLWLIFGATVIGPQIITQGKYLALTLGTLIFLFLAWVFTELVVEAFYFVYLKSQDKQYWEKRPPRQTEQREKKQLLKKIMKWVLILFGIFVLLLILTIMGKE